MDKVEIKRIEKIYYENYKENKTGMARLMWDKIDFRKKGVTKDKEEWLILKTNSSGIYNIPSCID